MKIYLAGKWEEHNKIRSYMDRIEAAGHVITCDWTTHDSASREAALLDFIGVLRCDLLIFIAETDGLIYRGSLVEMGVALGQEKPVWVVGNGIDKCIFINLPGVVKLESFDHVERKLKGGGNGRVHRRSSDCIGSKVS